MTGDIYEVLTEQHDAAKRLLHELVDPSVKITARLRREHYADMAVALISHNEAESVTLYQRLRNFADMRDHVDEHEREHDAANQELRALMEAAVDGAAWLRRFENVKAAIERHIDDEESRLFPEAREHLSEQLARVLADDFIRIQSQCIESIKRAA